MIMFYSYVSLPECRCQGVLRGLRAKKWWNFTVLICFFNYPWKLQTCNTCGCTRKNCRQHVCYPGYSRVRLCMDRRPTNEASTYFRKRKPNPTSIKLYIHWGLKKGKVDAPWWHHLFALKGITSQVAKEPRKFLDPWKFQNTDSPT